MKIKGVKDPALANARKRYCTLHNSISKCKWRSKDSEACKGCGYKSK